MPVLLMTVLLFGIAESSDAIKPIVSLNPPWSNIFAGESVTLTCNIASTERGYGGYVWYKNYERMDGNNKSFTINSAKWEDNGNYQCEANAELGNAVRLQVSDEFVILQVPYATVEGDDLSLRCHTRSGYTIKSTIFYMDGKKVFFSYTSSVFNEREVDANFSAIYKCEVQYTESNMKRDAQASVFIQELFSYPETKVNPYPVVEGAPMTISCHTTLNLLRASTDLQYAFYQNGRRVKEFSSSKKYHVVSAQWDHSGYYDCEVKTLSGSIKKRSSEIYIEISERKPGQERRDYTLQNIIRLVLSASPANPGSVNISCLNPSGSVHDMWGTLAVCLLTGFAGSARLVLGGTKGITSGLSSTTGGRVAVGVSRRALFLGCPKR